MTRFCISHPHSATPTFRNGSPARLVGSRLSQRGLVAAAAVVLLTGCSGGSHPAKSPTSTPVTTPSGTPTASRTGPVPPTPLSYAPADPDRIGAWLVIQPLPALTPEQKVVADRLLAYRQAMTQAANRRTMDFKFLESLATGNSETASLEVIGERVKFGQFTVGYATVQVRSVQVDKTTATVEICQEDHSYEVDLHGKVAVSAPNDVALSHYKMLLVNGTWLVAQQLDFIRNGCSMQAAS